MIVWQHGKENKKIYSRSFASFAGATASGSKISLRTRPFIIFLSQMFLSNLFNSLPVSFVIDRRRQDRKIWDRKMSKAWGKWLFAMKAYLGEVEMWNYIDSNGVLLLFYDPKDRIALTTVDWT